MYTDNAKKKLSDQDVEIAVAQNRMVVIDLESKTPLSLTHFEQGYGYPSQDRTWEIVYQPKLIAMELVGLNRNSQMVV